MYKQAQDYEMEVYTLITSIRGKKEQVKAKKERDKERKTRRGKKEEVKERQRRTRQKKTRQNIGQGKTEQGTAT